jgi:multimeric flavodoxin WrbA
VKTVIINGSPRKGNTYAATQLFKDEMSNSGDVEFIEFFLPQDLPEFCKGCMGCLESDEKEKKCPDSRYTLPILEALVKADAIIFTTPVYVLQAAGAVKAFLDHFAFMFLVHRAYPEMFTKKAFVISTTAGAGTRASMKTIITSLKFWGVNRVYSYGVTMWGIDWQTMPPKRRQKAEKKLKKYARRFYKEVKSGKIHSAYLLMKFMFYFRRGMIKKEAEGTADKKYWTEMNWFKENPFGRNKK